MSLPATRLITLILLLQRRPNQKAADLAAALGISVRSLHRYFGMLDEMGIPIYSERGPHGGFSLLRGYKLPPLVFTPEEATAIYLGAGLVEDLWGSLYRDAARGALAKLSNVLPEEQQQEVAWARRSLVATGLHRADQAPLAPALEKLRQGVRERISMRIAYQSSGQAVPQTRRLDPYALVHRSGWWYVVGYCHLRQAVRSFRVDRITSLELTDQVFQPSPDFDVRVYLEKEFKDQPHLQVRLRFTPQAAAVAHSSRDLWETLEGQPDGAIEVTLVTVDLTWAASTVLSFGPIVTVLEPPELRAMLADWAREIVKQYA
jgi:predicted DNA-binding transcriptional regulator YafY